MNSIEIVLICILLVICVVLSAFFSGSEIVYNSVNKLKLKRNSDSGDRKAKNALDIVEDYQSLLSSILVGNNLVNIGASSAATMLAVGIWGESNGPLIATIGMTMIILIFGEILPKTILVKNTYRVSLMFAMPLKILKKVLFFISYPITKLVDKISVIWTSKETIPTATDEELITMVDEIEEHGYIDEDTGDLIKSAIDFTGSTVHEIMTPRVDIFAYDIDDSIDELINNPNLFKYSRVPVYHKSIDNIVGVISTRSILKALLLDSQFDVKELMIEPIFVHKTKSISGLLSVFKETHHHMAFVVDEFGGILGLVTLEDVLEELVGDIWDEMDTPTEDYEEVDKGIYIVDGDMNIYDFFDLVEYDASTLEFEYTTVGGWCTDMLSRFPTIGDIFTFENIKVEIQSVDNVRVDKAKVEIMYSDTDDNDNNGL